MVMPTICYYRLTLCARTRLCEPPCRSMCSKIPYWCQRSRTFMNSSKVCVRLPHHASARVHSRGHISLSQNGNFAPTSRWVQATPQGTPQLESNNTRHAPSHHVLQCLVRTKWHQNTAQTKNTEGLSTDLSMATVSPTPPCNARFILQYLQRGLVDKSSSQGVLVDDVIVSLIASPPRFCLVKTH